MTVEEIRRIAVQKLEASAEFHVSGHQCVSLVNAMAAVNDVIAQVVTALAQKGAEREAPPAVDPEQALRHKAMLRVVAKHGFQWAEGQVEEMIEELRGGQTPPDKPPAA